MSIWTSRWWSAPGRGYSPAEERTRLPLGEIPVDAIYSPVRKAAYRVERTRIGQQTDYDRLNLEIWTDGTDRRRRMRCVRPPRFWCQHLTLLAGAKVVEIEEPEEEEEGIPGRIYDAPIEELELTVRAYNCLKRAGITKVGEILRKHGKGRRRDAGDPQLRQKVVGRTGREVAREELSECAGRGLERLLWTMANEDGDEDDDDEATEDEPMMKRCRSGRAADDAAEGDEDKADSD